MRKNLMQTAVRDSRGNLSIPGDWFHGRIPDNFLQGEGVYIDSSWAFDSFFSKNREAMTMGYASSCYDRATFVLSGTGMIEVGSYTILNGCTLICNNHISLGTHVMVAWGAVITDNYLGSELNVQLRSRLMEMAGKSRKREMPFSDSQPVCISDNVWIGFDAVILPGTRIGRGTVVGCKSVVSGEVPEYCVIAGNPGKIIKRLNPDE